MNKTGGNVSSAQSTASLKKVDQEAKLIQGKAQMLDTSFVSAATEKQKLDESFRSAATAQTGATGRSSKPLPPNAQSAQEREMQRRLAAQRQRLNES